VVYVDVAAGAVLHLHFKTVGVGVARNHRRRENHHAAVAHVLRREVVELLDDVFGALRLVAFAPVLKLDDECAVGGALSGDKAVAVDGLAHQDAGNLRGERVDLLHYLGSAFLR